MHQNGFDLEWKRVDDAVASKLKATIEDRIKNKIAAPGSEAALRRHLTELQQGQMEFDDLSPQLAEAVREQLPLIQQMLATAGPMQTITFKGVGPMGVDVYVVKYENANWEWRIVMGTDGKITGMGGQPQPNNNSDNAMLKTGKGQVISKPVCGNDRIYILKGVRHGGCG